MADLPGDTMTVRLTRLAVAMLAALLVLGIGRAASAVSIGVEIIDTRTLRLTFSGTMQGPVPLSSVGTLFVDTPVPGTLRADLAALTSDVQLGPYPLFRVHSGYDNVPYGGSLQLRNSVNGNELLSVGDVLSGTALMTFDSSHGMMQSMFDAPGLPVYWGRNFPEAGTLQGVAIPEPSTALLLTAGLAWAARRRSGPGNRGAIRI
jgi:hypothetical protein